MGMFGNRSNKTPQEMHAEFMANSDRQDSGDLSGARDNSKLVKNNKPVEDREAQSGDVIDGK